MLYIINRPTSDNDVGLPCKNRFYQVWYIKRIILIIGISIYNHVSAEPDTRFKTSHKPFGQSFVF